MEQREQKAEPRIPEMRVPRHPNQQWRGRDSYEQDTAAEAIGDAVREGDYDDE